MAKAKSEFLEWFESQFGKRPVSERDEIKLQQKFDKAQHEVWKIERKIRDVRSWDSDCRAALYSWNAALLWRFPSEVKSEVKHGDKAHI